MTQSEPLPSAASPPVLPLEMLSCLTLAIQHMTPWVVAPAFLEAFLKPEVFPNDLGIQRTALKGDGISLLLGIPEEGVWRKLNGILGKVIGELFLESA